jgi:hypothetical protein
MEMSLHREWVVLKRLKTPLRNIKMAPNSNFAKIPSAKWLFLYNLFAVAQFQTQNPSSRQLCKQTTTIVVV